MSEVLTENDVQQLRKEFDADASLRLAQNAVTQTSIDDVALDRAVVMEIDSTMSNRLDDWKVTNQKHSGRCWLFAGLNLLRAGAMAKLNVKDFEFSQNHIMFYDKLERANYFLQAIIDTADRDVDDRTVANLLDHAAEDGGQWNMFIALVRKHGLVPKQAMPETQSSSATRKMNEVLQQLLRKGAKELRALPADRRAEHKSELVSLVYRVLAIHLGTPPEQVYWQWTDKDKGFHRDGNLTPQQFAERYVSIPVDDYVCLVNDPRPTSPVGKIFTVEYLGNVLGGPRVTYLNVDIDVMKKAASECIVGGEPVWFGCDVGKQMRRDLGLWDAKLFDLEAVYKAQFDMDKADRLIYHDTAMTHAMLLTGVDIVDGAPRKWRVENSWGDENADSGFYTMNDSWFEQYVFEVAVRKEALPAELREALTGEPIVLPAWDPMGALAQ